MKIVVLASGSKGNATYIEHEGFRLLIDAGISRRQLDLRLQQRVKTLKPIDAILITHEHRDHTSGLASLMNHNKALLYTTKETFKALNHTVSEACFRPLEIHQNHQIGPLFVTVFPISHDASNPIGFQLTTARGKRLVYMTDTGYIPQTYYETLRNADFYIFEANYDVALLFNSGRPYYLKKRIDSVKGHLSNADSAYHLAQLVGENTKGFILAHPSAECNTEHHVIETFNSVFESYDLNLSAFAFEIASQTEPSQRYIIE